MSRSLASLFALYVSTPGRRIWALGQVLARIESMDIPELVIDIEAAINHDRQTLDLDAARRKGVEIVPVREHDLEFDRTLVAITKLLEHYVGGKEATAKGLLADMFPVSLVHHIRLPFVEQAAANERVLKLFESPDYQPWLAARGLGPLIKDANVAHEAFAAALEARDSAKVPSWDDVKAARARGQELYLQVVAFIVAQFRKDHETRDHLLEPIYTQDEAIKQARRQRGTIQDVDPDTGELLPDDELAEGEGETTVDDDVTDGAAADEEALVPDQGAD